jgi:sporulation protein YlmC with PRC-barrel domain
MKANISIVAALAMMTVPALAQEPSPSPAPAEKAPSTQTEPMTPSTTPAPAAPSAPSATEPAPSTAPSADKEAAAPAPSAPTSVSDLKKSEDDNKMVAPLNASVDKVEEMDIYDANGKKIAEVDSVLEDSSGEVKGLAIEYGGFLGFGEKGAIVTLDQVKQKDGNLTIDLTEDQLSTLPAWND